MTLSQLIEKLRTLETAYGDRRVSIGRYRIETDVYTTRPLRAIGTDEDGGSVCLSSDPELKRYSDVFIGDEEDE